MKKILYLLLTALLTLPVQAKNTILVLGDSISAGYGIDPAHGWVALLQQRLTQQGMVFQVINSSISGDTTSDGLNRIDAELKRYRPVLTIVALGGNDGLRGLPIATIQSNLQAIVVKAKRANSRVILVALRLPSNYGEVYNTQFAKLFQDIASAEQVTLVPLFLKNIDTNASLMQADRIHPTTQAQSILLDNVWEAVKKNLS